MTKHFSQQKPSRSILVGDLCTSARGCLQLASYQHGLTYSYWRENLLALIEQGGWTDSVRAHFGPKEILFSWWSYRARDWVASNRGRRLDHIWVSGDLASKVEAVTIESVLRGAEKPSDHALDDNFAAVMLQCRLNFYQAGQNALKGVNYPQKPAVI